MKEATMKKTYITTILSALLVIAFIQTPDSHANDTDLTKIEITITDDSTKVYTIVDQMPQIIGGIGEVYKNIDYPKTALNNRTEGKVYIQFVVDEHGKVDNPKVLKDIGDDCGNAAIAALEKMNFTPGLLNGEPVAVSYTLPVIFKMGN